LALRWRLSLMCISFGSEVYNSEGARNPDPAEALHLPVGSHVLLNG
jgi:hypothetical protein